MTADPLNMLARALGLSLAETPDLHVRLQEQHPPVSFVLNGDMVAASLGAPRVPHPAIVIPFEVAGLGRATVHLPFPALERLSTGPVPQILQDHGDTRALLLEVAFLPLIEVIEAALDVHLRVTDQPADGAYRTGLQLTGKDFTFGCLLDMDGAVAAHVAARLEQAFPQPQPDLGQQAVELTVCLGHQYVTQTEQNALRVGDVIVAEPGPMRVIANNRLGATVRPSPEGLILETAFAPLHDTPPPEWLQITFSPSRFRMRLEAFARLAPTHPLPVAFFSDAAVDLMINDKPFGRGAIIPLGTATGVRVIHLHNAAAVSMGVPQ